MNLSPPRQESAAVPVSVLTGFLGSGKTTLLAKFLRHPGMANTIVIMNEFGEVGLDHELLQVPEEEVVLLNNGCLCCAVLGDLITTLSRLFQKRAAGEIPRFQRVVIETSGLADPAPILQTLIAEPEVADLVTLDTIVTVVDAVNAPTQLDAHFECVKQIAVADRIVLSKSDLATPATTAQLGSRLATLNPGAETWQVVRGDVGPELLFRDGTSTRNERTALESWLRGGDEQADCSHADHAHDHGHDHSHDHHPKPHAHHSDEVRSYSFWLDDPVHPEALRIWLDQLATFRGPKLLRVKGILNVDGYPTVVHAVQHLFHPPEALERWPSDERRSRIVVIAHQLERAQIEATLPLLAFRPQRTAQNKIDPRTFLDFSAAMRRIHGADAE